MICMFGKLRDIISPFGPRTNYVQKWTGQPWTGINEQISQFSQSSSSPSSSDLVVAAVHGKLLLTIQRILRKFLEHYLGPCMHIHAHKYTHTHAHTATCTLKAVPGTPPPCDTFHRCAKIRGLIGLKSLCCDRLQGQEVTQWLKTSSPSKHWLCWDRLPSKLSFTLKLPSTL